MLRTKLPFHDNSEKPSILSGFESINRYWDGKHDIYAAKILPGEFYVSLHGELITTVLGSCISVCIRDPGTGIGGMNHFMLPDHNDQHPNSWGNTPADSDLRYGSIAMERLINVILSTGSNKQLLEIKLFGGGKVININTDVGNKNIKFVKKYLQTEGLRIISEDVGGMWPRKVQYFPSTGRVRVKLLKLHNNTLETRERDYRKLLKHQCFDGSVDIFR